MELVELARLLTFGSLTVLDSVAQSECYWAQPLLSASCRRLTFARRASSASASLRRQPQVSAFLTSAESLFVVEQARSISREPELGFRLAASYSHLELRAGHWISDFGCLIARVDFQELVPFIMYLCFLSFAVWG